jgi:DUF1016 N-terminal domain
MTNQIESNSELLTAIRNILLEARTRLQKTVNSAMVQAYWNIGRLIVEHEQKGQARAAYGQYQLKHLAQQLQTEFGKGFYERNLRRMRAFYLVFPIWTSVRSELSWTHYRILIQVENQVARDWYLQESIEQNWSAKALERQIDKLYYERLLVSKQKTPVMEEAKAYTRLYEKVSLSNSPWLSQ